MTTTNEISALRKESFASASVDTEARKIEGYIVIERGPLKDFRDYIVDDETMSRIVELGNANESGLKVRWTHPDFMSDHLGKYLGRAVNFRVDGDYVRADMQFAKAAELSPVFDRDPVAYIIALAKEDPGAFATSIYFMRDSEAMYKLSELADGEEPTPIRISELYASDIVDEGAAANSFLSKNKPSASNCVEDEIKKEKDMAEEAKKIEEAQALAVEAANKASTERLQRLQDAFKGEPDFVLEQFSKGHDIVEAKADYSDILADRLAKSEAEKAELLKKSETVKVEGEEPVAFGGESDAGSNADQFEKLAREIAEEMKISIGEAYAFASAKRPDIAVV